MCIKGEIKRINRSKEWRLGVYSASCSKLDYIHDMLPKAWFPRPNTEERRAQQLTMKRRFAKPVLRKFVTTNRTLGGKGGHVSAQVFPWFQI